MTLQRGNDMLAHMAELTPDAVVAKVKRNEKIDRADLSGIHLANAALEGASFRRCDMVGANLENARLRNANLKSANLCEAFLSGADLRDANLDNADLEGANLQRSLLAGANLSRANLEGANLQGANLAGARLTHAQLDLANMGGADCAGAVLTHADLGECYLGGVKMMKSELTNANLSDSNLEDADFTGAVLADAQLRGVKARGVRLVGAILTKGDLSKANLASADLTNADLRNANLEDAKLEGANLTGAKVFGITAKGALLTGIKADWVDNSPNADGSVRVAADKIVAVLSGQMPAAAARPVAEERANRRYFGRGDVLRNASLQFDDGAQVEIDSLFEGCTIALGRGTELVVGEGGVLDGCQITGAGNITINGKFFEQASKKGMPAIVGAHTVVVSATGALVGAVQQAPEATRFAFEPGCKLRMRITTSSNGNGSKAAKR